MNGINCSVTVMPLYQNHVMYYSVELAAIREMNEETGIILDMKQLQFLCSLTLPANGRIVISLYCKLTGD